MSAIPGLTEVQRQKARDNLIKVIKLCHPAQQNVETLVATVENSVLQNSKTISEYELNMAKKHIIIEEKFKAQKRVSQTPIGGQPPIVPQAPAMPYGVPVNPYAQAIPRTAPMPSGEDLMVHKKLSEMRNKYYPSLHAMFTSVHKILSSEDSTKDPSKTQKYQSTYANLRTLIAILLGKHQNSKTMRGLEHAETTIQRFTRLGRSKSESVNNTTQTPIHSVQHNPNMPTAPARIAIPPTGVSSTVTQPVISLVDTDSPQPEKKDNVVKLPPSVSRPPSVKLEKNTPTLSNGRLPSNNGPAIKKNKTQRENPPTQKDILLLAASRLSNPHPFSNFVPIVESIVEAYETGSVSRHNFTQNSPREVSQDWWREDLEPENDSQIDLLPGCKILSKRTSDELNEGHPDHLHVPSHQISNVTKLAKISSSFSQERMLLANSREQQADLQEKIALEHISSPFEAKLFISPSWDTTLIDESCDPLLPHCSTRVQLNSDSSSKYLLSGRIVDQISFLKVLERRHAEIEKEIQALPEFCFTYLPPQCEFGVTLKCTRNNMPPILLHVPIQYPTYPVEYSFSPQYEIVKHFQKVREVLEQKLLKSNDLATIEKFLSLFLCAIDDVN
eukprot:CAMPEP_0117059662 /NCGR_PEP_ID=MMETSP0472-20121206/41468_1 /TAXON_ID=693140 ORGANISM="Tiarina fusus, Strain LIS" /NCGR_SAMPLE_ID=MMETSP0472 /ASSEMBLY_ACC=CAM_ASM_000603 /LENGTH=614 /DNA_ID=CAMNT_0004777507 /DNA_START=26 /DNA_END=1867 /DNA_ORIENTATION=-